MALKGKIINVICEKIVFPGRSLCRCLDGVVLFTDGLLPNEYANVLVLKDKVSFREGLVKEITYKSCERTLPLCPSFGYCGGCSFQNTSYENQIRYKQEYVSELLSFSGIGISKILTGPDIWFYRNKMEFSFFNYKTDDSVISKVNVGLHRKGSFSKYVPVPPCFICDRDFLHVLELIIDFANKNNISAYDNVTHDGFLRHLVFRKAANNKELLINIVTNNTSQYMLLLKSFLKKLAEFADVVYWTVNTRKSDAVVFDKITLMYGKPYINEKLVVGGKNYFFNISPFSFFQTNSKCAEILYNEILKLLNLSKDDVLLDLYCGTGTIGICMAHIVKKVVGIEQIGQAVEDAKENAALNNVFNVDFYGVSAEKWISESRTVFNIIIVDPPRSGLSKHVLNFLLNSKARKIVYVSCNPSTLARDLQIMIERHVYNVKAIVPVDMFPQTYHVEVIVLLELI